MRKMQLSYNDMTKKIRNMARRSGVSVAEIGNALSGVGKKVGALQCLIRR